MPRLIDDEILTGLPDDPLAEFMVFEQAIREKMAHEKTDHDNSAERLYVKSILAFLHGAELDLELDTNVPDDEDDFEDYLAIFVSEIEYTVIRYKVEHARRNKKGLSTIIALDSQTREKIHHYIGKIKRTLDKIDLPEKKREAIFSKINTLADEIDRDRTRFDIASSLVLETADTGGEAAKRLMPVRELLQPVINLFAKGAEQEALSHEAKKQIEGPRKQIEAPVEESKPTAA